MVDLWTEAVRSIEPMVKPAHRDLWLRPITCVGITEGRIQLRAPNRYHKEWFKDNFLPSILRDLEARAHQSFAVDFELAEEAPAPFPALAERRAGADALGLGEARTSGMRSLERGRSGSPVGRSAPPDLISRY